MAIISPEAYKQAKIDSISNLTGSGKSDLLVVFAVAGVCSLFHRAVGPKVAQQRTLWRFVLEMLYMVGPPLFVLTYADYALPLYAVMIATSLFCYNFFSAPKGKGKERESVLASLNSPRKPFLDEFRAHMMLMTCLAILAVDFTVFPRRFAKTETYGISVMDMGVGGVVLAGALVSRQARAAIPHTTTGKTKAKGGKGEQGRLYFAWGAIKSTLPLVILGLARIVVTKSANYHEHVSEYGVHWNFFFTLGSVALFTALLNVPTKYAATVGLAIACIYQYVLSNYGLREFILNHPRDNLISANKEGLSSIFGYFAIYLVGTQLGYSLFTPRKSKHEWQSYTIFLILVTGISFFGAYASEIFVDPVSRRMANLTYVLYTIAYTLFTLTVCLVVSLFFENSPSLILSAINRNQLFFFLLGNISTGLVNISMYTLYTPPLTSMAVLFAYSLFLCAVAVVLDKRNIVLRI